MKTSLLLVAIALMLPSRWQDGAENLAVNGRR